MISCTIEFGIKEGKSEQVAKLLSVLMNEVEKIDGYISKESFESRDNADKLISLSYWRDEKALEDWNKNRAHVFAMSKGKNELFNYYNIQISSTNRTHEWHADT